MAALQLFDRPADCKRLCRVPTTAALRHGLKMMLETAERLFLLTGPTETTRVLEQNQTHKHLLGFELRIALWFAL